jgi:hypothetical protein
MIGERFGQAPRKGRLRRLLLLLIPLLAALALGELAVASWRGQPAAGSPAVPGTSAGPSATAGQSGASPSSSQLVPTSPPTPAVSGSGSGTGVARIGDAGFTIRGSVSNLAPGVARPIQLTLANPNGFPIYVTALTVSVSADSTPPGCSSAGNLQVTQSNASVANPIVIPAGSSVTLASAPRAPQITLLNLPGVNQDVCKGKSFVLTYSGSAHS